MDTLKILEMVFGSAGVTAAVIAMQAYNMSLADKRRIPYAVVATNVGAIAFFGGAMFLASMKSDFRVWFVFGGIGLAFGVGILLARALRPYP